MKTVHIELSYKGRDVGMLKILTVMTISDSSGARMREREIMGITHERTFENSDVGDMTKLSFVLDHDIKCWMLGSSNILRGRSATIHSRRLAE